MMRLWLISNSEYHNYVVVAESEYQALNLLTDEQRAPYVYGNPYSKRKTSAVAITEIRMDTPGIIAESHRMEEWM